MSQGDELELLREATTNPEREQGTEGGQKREHADDGMTAAPETLHFLGFWSFEQGQGGEIQPSGVRTHREEAECSTTSTLSTAN